MSIDDWKAWNVATGDAVSQEYGEYDRYLRYKTAKSLSTIADMLVKIAYHLTGEELPDDPHLPNL